MLRLKVEKMRGPANTKIKLTISRSAATRVVSLFYLTPPVTALMAWALFNERLAVEALIGMVFCVIGVFLVNSQTAAR